MSSSTDDRIPAWKRLGLKLKAAPDSQTDNVSSQTPAAPSPIANGVSAPAKRKSFGASEPDHSSKKPRREDVSTPSKSTTPKAVSFAAEPEVRTFTTPTAKEKKPPKKEKQKQHKPTQQTPRGTQPNSTVKPLVKKENAVVNLKAALEYLRQWHSSRDSWKFNKNHQTRLLEYIFSDETTIPAVDINILYEYISPLKGFVRKRLRETAVEVKNKDMDQGAEGFSSSNKQVAERKQKEYEETIAGFLKEGASPGKRRFEEVEYVLRTADIEMQRRVVKRMRAEMVIEELSGSEGSELSTNTATVTEAESEDTTGSGSKEEGSTVTDGDKRVKLNDGTQRRIRRNKVRTAEVDDTSSSSEDDSDSGSDSNTSSSDSDSSDDSDDDDDAMEVDQARNDAETSSSSSSSSSSEAESDDESSDEDEA